MEIVFSVITQTDLYVFFFPARRGVVSHIFVEKITNVVHCSTICFFYILCIYIFFNIIILVLNMVVLNIIWLTVDSTFISEITLASMIYPSVTPYHSGSKVSCRRPRL